MNKYFIGKVRNLKGNLPQSNRDPLTQLRTFMTGRECSLSLKPVHPDKVDKMIRNLKSSGAAGLDYIDTLQSSN